MKEILFQEYFELHWDSLLFVLFSWIKVCGICCCISKEGDAKGVSRKVLLVSSPGSTGLGCQAGLVPPRAVLAI